MGIEITGIELIQALEQTNKKKADAKSAFFFMMV